MIPYGKQSISQADIDAVIEVLTSDFLTQGPLVPAFENSVKELAETRFAVATNSATSALHIACVALGLGPGDIVWTTPITFVATANCALYCGAAVDFVDIDEQTYNLSVEKLSAKLESAESEGTLPKIIIPVHLAGQSCEMAQIKKLADKYGVAIIEDASHAIGGKYKNKAIGNCEYSDVTVFSFHPVKIITSAEGGMALTNSRHLAQQMELLRSHGITRDPDIMQGSSHGPWYYQQLLLGFNYRMNDIQAALGVSQLGRLEEFVKIRNTLAETYTESLNELPIQLPNIHSDCYSAWHLYIIRLNDPINDRDHRTMFESLRNSGIGVNLHYIPVHLQPFYRKLGFSEGDYPVAESYYKSAITIPIFPELTPQNQNRVIDVLTELLQ